MLIRQSRSPRLIASALDRVSCTYRRASGPAAVAGVVARPSAWDVMAARSNSAARRRRPTCRAGEAGANSSRRDRPSSSANSAGASAGVMARKLRLNGPMARRCVKVRQML